MKWILMSFVVCASSVLPLVAAPLVVQSPDGKISLSIEEKNGALLYSIQRGKELLIAPSSVEIFKGAKMSVVDSSIRENDSTWSPTWGQFSTIRDHCRELSVSVTADGTPVTLLCRAYDDGVGFRFAAAADQQWVGKPLDFSLQCKMEGDYEAYYTQGEKDPAGPIPSKEILAKRKSFKMPFVMESGEGTWLALLESDLYTAKLFDRVAAVNVDVSKKTLELAGKGKANGQAFVSPWRVVLVGDSPGGLVESTVALNLAAPCEIEDTSWIKAGKGLWDWRVHGYDNGAFKYGIDTRSYLRFIDFAAEHGIEYFTIDDHWYKGGEGGELVTDPAIDIEKVMAYAKEKGVKVVLYFDRRKDKGQLIADPALFKYYRSLGAAGIKYGFQGAKVGFTRSSIDGAAAEKMFIFYHDGPAAMTGVERTMPNLFSREFCHAQQDSRKAFSPTGFLKMAMINALSGPLDMANGNFGIKSINAGERKKGPLKRNTYVSTVVSEVARCVVISSALITLPDAPEEYAKKSDLFAFLKEMPATWDETRVINSKMAEYITTARRTGDAWFVGSVNNEELRELPLTLDFLDPKTVYEATLYQDAPDAHGVKNPEAYEIKKQTVKRGVVIPAKMAIGGGHAMILKPVK